jgi:outer membrane protein
MSLVKCLIAFSVFVVVCAAPVFGQDGKKWTLEECVEYAHENNLNVQRGELNMRNNEALLRQSQLSRIPTLSMNVFNGWRSGRSIDPTTNTFVTNTFLTNGFNWNSNVMLYNGMQQVNAVRQGRKDMEAAYYDLQKTRNDVALDVVGGYLNVVFARELLENARTQLASTQAQLDQTEKLVEAGSLPVTNLLNLQSELASNEVQVINRENDVQFAMLQLKQFLQIPASEDFDIVTPEFGQQKFEMVPYTAEGVYREALETQPEIKSADLSIESATLGERIARGAQVPRLSLGLSASTNYSDQFQTPTGETQTIQIPSRTIGYLQSDPSMLVQSIPFQEVVPITEVRGVGSQWIDNRGFNIGFNLAIPIFQGYQIRTGIQQARLQRESAEIAATETKNILRQTIETAYNDAQAASKVFEAAEKQVAALEESFRATERSYNLGAANFLDYQVASNNLFQARSDLVRAKFDYIFKLKILDFYLGNPLTF